MARQISIGRRLKAVEVDDVDLKSGRITDMCAWTRLTDCEWVQSRRNAVILGPCGIGKTFVASALCQKLLQDGYSVAHIYDLRFLAETRTRAERLFIGASFETDLLVIDEFSPAGLTGAIASNFLQLLEQRRGKSVMLVSRIPIHQWDGACTVRHAINQLLSSVIVLELRQRLCCR